jgi:ribonuclease HII
MPSGDTSCRVGVDENGLGARLGPLIVTAVLARVRPVGERALSRRLRGKISEDLGDSKRLVSHQNFTLGEAWARVLTGNRADSPRALFEQLSAEPGESLRKTCPGHIEGQCWDSTTERFAASPELLARLGGHLGKLAERGIEVERVQVQSVCTQRLNRARRDGKNRFVSDLHAMEELLLGLRQRSGDDFVATCGKVGGMSEYDRFFGPLAGRLHTTLLVSRRQSSYYFPGIGEIHFVQDADARHLLVMLASLVGKYVRELLMGRISRFYDGADSEDAPVSGYHDERTDGWVAATEKRRRSLRILDDCFERARDTLS